jgi:hypothetical protein
MSVLAKLKKAGLKENLMVTAEFAAASYGFGYLQNRYRQKAQMFGVPADLLAGVAFKAASLGSHVFGVGHALAPHLDIVGNAGVGAFFHTLGAGHGAKASGVKRLLVGDADLEKVKKVLPNPEIIGAIGKAPHGDFLSASELAALAR